MTRLTARPIERASQALPRVENQAYCPTVIILVRLARILLILLLATITISLVIGVGRPEIGAVEKIVLLALIAGCVVLAARISTLTTNAQERLRGLRGATGGSGTTSAPLT